VQVGRTGKEEGKLMSSSLDPGEGSKRTKKEEEAGGATQRKATAGGLTAESVSAVSRV
jgi:hypothetical protein